MISQSHKTTAALHLLPQGFEEPKYLAFRGMRVAKGTSYSCRLVFEGLAAEFGFVVFSNSHIFALCGQRTCGLVKNAHKLKSS